MENLKLRRRNDLTGKSFGRLTVLKAGERRTATRGMYWLCKCECGTIKEISALSLVRGLVVSCGCYCKEINSLRVVHGQNRRHSKKTPTYTSWAKMNDRCNNQKCKEYQWYGAKGIIVCESWRNFENFFKDMGVRPIGTTIDRIDSSGNYEPSNCRWETAKNQANNTSRNVSFEHNGKLMTISELAELADMEYDTMYCRLIKYKWSVQQSISTPTKKMVKKV